MDNEKQQEKLRFFIKTGIVVLSFLVLMALGIKYIPAVVTVTNSANTKKLPINSVEQDKKVVSLSFDTVSGDEDTTEILEILAQNNVKATFFITGEWAKNYPDDVKAIAGNGHDLANLSEDYKHMTQLNKEECKNEILLAHNEVKQLTGIEMNLFRPPYGDYNDTLLDITNELGYHCIQWDVNSLDWKDYGVDSVVDTVINNSNLENGSIILLHNGAKYTKDALPLIIEGLQDKSYQIVPISQLIYNEDYYMDQNGRQFHK